MTSIIEQLRRIDELHERINQIQACKCDTVPPYTWRPSDGLRVWDGSVYYECQAMQWTDRILFMCGKCMGATYAQLLTAPGQVCEGCFSLAMERASGMASPREQYMQGRMGTFRPFTWY